MNIIQTEAVLIHQCKDDIIIGTESGNIAILKLKEMMIVDYHEYVVPIFDPGLVESPPSNDPSEYVPIEYEHIKLKSFQVHGEVCLLGYGSKSKQWVIKTE